MVACDCVVVVVVVVIIVVVIIVVVVVIVVVVFGCDARSRRKNSHENGKMGPSGADDDNGRWTTEVVVKAIPESLSLSLPHTLMHAHTHTH